MSDKTVDNPAWRLYDLIERGMKRPNGTIREFWARAFGVSPDDTTAIFKGLFLLHGLVDVVEELVRELDNVDHDYYLKNFPSIRKAVTLTNLDRPSSEVTSLLSGLTLRDIGFWANQISGDKFSDRLQNEELKDLKNEIDELFDEVAGSSINSELRRAVLSSLENVRRAIVEYLLRGSEGLREELERSVAGLARYAAELKREQDAPWYGKLVALLVKVDTVAERGKKYVGLMKSATRLLLPGTLPSVDE